MNVAHRQDEKIFKLGWKGIFFQFDALLYAEPETPGWLLIPITIGLFIPHLLLSYLKVTSNGLHLHFWPKYTTQVKWEEIDRLGKCRFLFLFPCDALFLKKAEAKTKNATLRDWGLAKKCIIPLSDFQGWPDGELAQCLKKYIPAIILGLDD